MDEIKQRLQETSEKCIECYEAWSKDKKNTDINTALQESVHELRRVASRLEIELAINERNESIQKPIPIPTHRDSKRRVQGFDDNRGNQDSNVRNSRTKFEQKSGKRHRPSPRKST